MAEPNSAEPPVSPNPVPTNPVHAESAVAPDDAGAESRVAPNPVPPNPDTAPAERVLDAEIVEPSSSALSPNPVAPDYTDAGVPTFTHVRDRIEQRIGRAIGSEELAHETPVGRSVQEQWDAREKAAKERLEQIRKSLHKDSGSSE